MDFVKKNLFVIITVICVIVLGVVYLYERNKPSPVLQPNSQAITLYSADEEVADGLNAGLDKPDEDKRIKVYITGAVVNPGVYEVQADARVDDVLKMAGGAVEEADLLRVNLAAYVTDAQQIVIPVEGEVVDSPEAAGTNADGLIDINKADAALLQTLPGVGPVIAQNIIDYREQNGEFKTIDDIKKVSRIGEATFNKMKDKIKV